MQCETVEKGGNEYRYKLLRDTLRIIESDTIYIPYGVKVADNGKDKSFLPRFSELAKVAFLVVTAALPCGLYYATKRDDVHQGDFVSPFFDLR